jgi:hypothetical protein
MAINTCNDKPMPTVFQLMAFLLELNKNEIRMSTAIPNAPLNKVDMENPWLGIISATSSWGILSVIVEPMATLSESAGNELWPKATEQTSKSKSKLWVFFAM